MSFVSFQAPNIARSAVKATLQPRVDRTRSFGLLSVPRRTNGDATQQARVVGTNASRRTLYTVAARSHGDATRNVALKASSADFGGANGTVPSGGGSRNPLEKFTSGLRDRMEVDPHFLFKLGSEISIDALITVAVNIMVRGSPATWAFSASLMVLCQLFTAVINDTLIVYFLAPTKSSVGKIPEMANVFEKGDYSRTERLLCYLKKGRFYAIIGAMSCVLSMFLALTLQGNPGGFTQEVFFRAIACGSLHMGISSNTRYQLVNGIERVVYDVLPVNMAKLVSIGARMGNNFMGARLWMMVAMLTGLS
jgi:hypothetical protein